MRQATSKALKTMYIEVSARKKVRPTKFEFRKIKKFYNALPRTQKRTFHLV